MCVVLCWGNHVEKSESENFGDAEWKTRSNFWFLTLETTFSVIRTLKSVSKADSMLEIIQNDKKWPKMTWNQVKFFAQAGRFCKISKKKAKTEQKWPSNLFPVPRQSIRRRTSMKRSRQYRNQIKKRPKMTKNDPKMANKIGDFDNNSTGFFYLFLTVNSKYFLTFFFKLTSQPNFPQSNTQIISQYVCTYGFQLSSFFTFKISLRVSRPLNEIFFVRFCCFQLLFPLLFFLTFSFSYLSWLDMRRSGLSAAAL